MIPKDASVTIKWLVEIADIITFDGKEVEADDAQNVSPRQKYTLAAKKKGEEVVTRTLKVEEQTASKQTGQRAEWPFGDGTNLVAQRSSNRPVGCANSAQPTSEREKR